ncbi:glutamate-ammonia-ligase adenylyltransferase [Bombiscardovia nodaiensis]|uniref:Glutamate-ammonia-ligase adenylyltransferase n=1 Tax=Bombiscardovia nodaiensis TaxID=2932181 RepID=A0ABM8B8P2_9BIFI|nr:glutamate-ammonia-ligase adenylyltransferase [Bombiscardovia nodaiensis]
MGAEAVSESQGWSSVRLIRAGLRHLGRARRELSQLADMGLDDGGVDALLLALGQACDADRALEALVHILASPDEMAAPNEPADSVQSLAYEYAIGLNKLSGGKAQPRNTAGSAPKPRATTAHAKTRWLAEHPQALARLVAVLGASQAMGNLMRNRPYLVVAAFQQIPVGQETADAAHPKQVGQPRILALLKEADAQGHKLSFADGVTLLRAAYYTRLAAIMAQDLSSDDPTAQQPEVSLALSRLADEALEGALAIAQAHVPGSEACRFALIGMGKLGAQELNYVSDVDLVYVVEPAPGEHPLKAQDLVNLGTQVATNLQRICQSVISGVNEPPLWKVDTALRPEGKDGPLVRSLDSFEEYYANWAQNWEFQALLKARFVAGDVQIGQEYQTMCDELVWKASARPNFVYDCQQMRSRVEYLIPAKLRDREIKLGQGGLRDVEFTVQMLQLVHGRTDSSLHERSTLEALRALAEGGYISSHHAQRLAADYRFERVLEHRQQMWMLKRTHLFPDLGVNNRGGLERRRKLTLEDLDGNDDLYRLARAFRLHPDELVERYDRARREIRTLHLSIYFRPMLPIEAQLDDDEVSLKPQAAKERFASIGFADPDAALRHVEALTKGLTRSAKINRILLPAVFAWLGNGQDPDMGLLGWRTLEERFGTKSSYLAFLRDSTSAARRLCHVLANSRYLSRALCQSVESVTWLGDDKMLKPRSRASLDTSCRSFLLRHAEQMGDFATALRAMRRREIERIGLGWLCRVCDESECLAGMSDVYDAMIEAALAWSVQAQEREQALTQPAASIAVIALGRYGGREVNFSSDADVMLIFDPAAGATPEEAEAFAQGACDKLRAILSSGTLSLEAKLDLDLDLRPEGRSGPLIRSLDSTRLYYQQWSSVWERQALLRARYAAGNRELCERFLHGIADPLRYAQAPVSAGELAEIRKLKARMEAERLPRGVRRDRHLKLGAGVCRMWSGLFNCSSWSTRATTRSCRSPQPCKLWSLSNPWDSSTSAMRKPCKLAGTGARVPAMAATCGLAVLSRRIFCLMTPTR